MAITPSLVEALLKCPTKCWLRSAGEPTAGNAYAEWVQTQNEWYRAEAAKRLIADEPVDECSAGSPAENLKAAKWRLAVNVNVVAHASVPASSGSVPLPEPKPGETPGKLADETSALQSRLHAVERIPSEGRGKAAQFIPIRFIFRNKLTKDDKLLLAFDAFVLSEMLGREISLGKIIHGDSSSLARESAAEKSAHGSTGYQPVSSGNLPDGTARTTAVEPDAGFIPNASPIPVGESPIGTGESPVPPGFRIGSYSTADGSVPVETHQPAEASAALSRAQPQVVRVKTAALAGEVRKRIEKIAALLSSPTPPDLILNRHCPECEFRDRCRKIAIEKDDLSLLAGMSAKERQKLRSKGIFTVTQLSLHVPPAPTSQTAS